MLAAETVLEASEYIILFKVLVHVRADDVFQYLTSDTGKRHGPIIFGHVLTALQIIHFFFI